ncbi:MAG: DUF4192 domain-containing protein [Jatrophihabitantaceae bacterium]
MTTDHDAEPLPTLRLKAPGDLLQAIPYLLGFHPKASLVLVGLSAGALVVTVRVDLSDLAQADVLAETIAAMRRGAAEELIGAVYDDGAEPTRSGSALPWAGVAPAIDRECLRLGCELTAVLLVVGQRWWSYLCKDPTCCPQEGRPVSAGPSVVSAAATYAGMVALPDRETLAAVLDPQPEDVRAALFPLVAEEEDSAVRAVLDASAERRERAVKRAIFSAARDSEEPGWPGGVALDDATVARFAVALSGRPTRDAVWMAVDDGRLDGRALWRDLARRLPQPYDAAPLFLFGWASWRAGSGALAGIAADRAVASDPGYSAADLLLAALARGMDPRQLPKLRLPRSA